MAIRWVDEFIASQRNVADGNYPGGSAKDVSTPSGVDGTPLTAVWVNDWSGFFQKILDAASKTPSGSPDTILASDYYDSLIAIQKIAFGTDALRSFATVAAMVAASDLSVGDFVRTESYLSGANKGGALYVVVAAATGTQDGGRFINLATHQAQLVPSDVVSSSQYGAASAADNTTKIQALLDSLFVRTSIDVTSTISGAGLVLTDKKDILIDAGLSYTGSGACFTVASLGAVSNIVFGPNGSLSGDNATATQKGMVIFQSGRVTVQQPAISAFLDIGLEVNDSFECNVSGGAIAGATATAAILLTGTPAINNTIKDIAVTGSKVGLEAVGTSKNHFENLDFTTCVDSGIRLGPISLGAGDGAKSNKFINCRVDGCTNAATGGIEIIEDCDDNLFIGCSSNNNAGTGIFIVGASGFHTKRCQLNAMICDGNSGSGIEALRVDNLLMTNVILINNSASGYADKDCLDPKIIGGLIDNNGANGILHQSSLRTLNDGVTIINNTIFGVLITDAGSLTPESFRTINCHIDGNGSGPYSVSGSGLEDAKAMNCTGFVTDNRGVFNGPDNRFIPHGLSGTPVTVQLTTDDIGSTINADSISSTTIGYRLVDDTGSPIVTNQNTYWEAHLY